MAITGIFTRSTPTIAGLIFDAVLEESDELQTDVTQYAIEDGSIGNDFAVTQNQRFSMTVGVSDNLAKSLSAQASQADVLAAVRDSGLPEGVLTPIISGAAGVAVGGVLSQLSGTSAALAGLGASIAQASYAAGQAQTRSGTVLENIREIQRNNAIFTLTTSKGVYPACIITNTRRRTNPQNEQGLELVVEMQQLRIMNSTRRARFRGFQAAGVPAQNDTVSNMGQSKTNGGFIGTVEVVTDG